jgi:transketolase
MTAVAKTTMRDAVIRRVVTAMDTDPDIFFLSADLGAPALDSLRKNFGDRFINVGIAEQNLVSIAAGLALEGMKVFAFGLAPFISMRALEQIRNNLSLLGQLKPLNVTLLALGAGLSYDVSGPTHHCIEDLSIIRTLPNIALYSPSDPELAAQLIVHGLSIPSPKYVRLEGKPVASLYADPAGVDCSKGFFELIAGKDVCLVSSGFMVHECAKIQAYFKTKGIEVGLVDVFALSPLDEAALFDVLRPYSHLISVEESFIGRAGLDTLIMTLFHRRGHRAPLHPFGISDKYIFENGDRTQMHKMFGMDNDTIIAAVERLL